MSNRLFYVALCGVAAALASVGPTFSHEIVGNRFFPATLAIDDPGVNDEMALPTVSAFKTGDDPSVKQLDISGEFSKRITEDFGVSFGSTWTRRAEHDRRQWLPKSRDEFQIPCVQERRA